jgi:hypothetical protein
MSYTRRSVIFRMSNAAATETILVEVGNKSYVFARTESRFFDVSECLDHFTDKQKDTIGLLMPLLAARPVTDFYVADLVAKASEVRSIHKPTVKGKATRIRRLSQRIKCLVERLGVFVERRRRFNRR